MVVDSDKKKDIDQMVFQYHNPAPDQPFVSANDIIDYVESAFRSEQHMKNGTPHRNGILILYTQLLFFVEIVWNILRKASRVVDLFGKMMGGEYVTNDSIVVLAYNNTWGVLSGLHSLKAALRYAEHDRGRWENLKMTIWAKWCVYEKAPYLINGEILDILKYFGQWIRGINSAAEIYYCMQCYREGWLMGGKAVYLQIIRDNLDSSDASEKGMAQYTRWTLIETKLANLQPNVRDVFNCVMHMILLMTPKVSHYVNVKAGHSNQILDHIKANAVADQDANSKHNHLVRMKMYFLTRNSYYGTSDLPPESDYRIRDQDPSKFVGHGTDPEQFGLSTKGCQKWGLRRQNEKEKSAAELGDLCCAEVNSCLKIMNNYNGHAEDLAGTNTVMLNDFKLPRTAAGIKINDDKRVYASFPDKSHKLHQWHNDRGAVSTTLRLEDEEKHMLTTKLSTLGAAHDAGNAAAEQLHKAEVNGLKKAHKDTRAALKKTHKKSDLDAQLAGQLQGMKEAHAASVATRAEAHQQEINAIRAELATLQQSKQTMTHAMVKFNKDDAHPNGVPVNNLFLTSVFSSCRMPLDHIRLDIDYYTKLVTVKPVTDPTAQKVLGRCGNPIPLELPAMLQIYCPGNKKGEWMIKETLHLTVRWKGPAGKDDTEFEIHQIKKSGEFGKFKYHLEAKVVSPMPKKTKEKGVDLVNKPAPKMSAAQKRKNDLAEDLIKHAEEAVEKAKKSMKMASAKKATKKG
eukprot:g1478.t1